VFDSSESNPMHSPSGSPTVISCIYHIYTNIGRFQPPLALAKLLKVLGRHPDPLDEVKVA